MFILKGKVLIMVTTRFGKGNIVVGYGKTLFINACYILYNFHYQILARNLQKKKGKIVFLRSKKW